MKKKIKKTNRCKLACTLIQLYARLRDTDRNGNGFCRSCHKPLSWSDSPGGHFQAKTRGYNKACLNEHNVHLQDSRCNLYMSGNPAGYSQWMNENYSKDMIEQIRAESYQTMEPEYVEARIVELRAECKVLAATKNFVIRVP